MHFSPYSSTVPNPSASGPRMRDYAIRAGGAGAAAVQVVPGLLTVRTPVMATSHAIIGGPSVAVSAWAAASAFVPLSVSRSVAVASSSRRSDSKSTTSTTSSGNASGDVDGDEDIDFHRGGLHSLRHRQEQNIEVDVEEEGDVDEEEGKGVVSVRPMSRVWWEQQQQQYPPPP